MLFLPMSLNLNPRPSVKFFSTLFFGSGGNFLASTLFPHEWTNQPTFNVLGGYPENTYGGGYTINSQFGFNAYDHNKDGKFKYSLPLKCYSIIPEEQETIKHFFHETRKYKRRMD